jgi:predicted  nucleic acid-binding Zn-ribbon protein
LQKVEDAGGGAITYLFLEATKGLGHLDDLGQEIKFINQQIVTMNNNMSNMNKNMEGMNHNMLEMNRNMHNMSVNMSVMSRDMDSTMGRMGRMMPGGPGGWWW